MIWIDMDDVLAPFQAELMRRHPPSLQEKALDRVPGTWCLADELKISNNQFMEPALARRSQLAACLGITPWAHTLVEMCERIAGRQNVGILTSPYHRNNQVVPSSYDSKMQWVLRHFPRLAPFTIVSPVKSLIVKRDALIDDKEETIEEIKKQGGTGILWPHIGNSLHAHAHDPFQHFATHQAHALHLSNS